MIEMARENYRQLRKLLPANRIVRFPVPTQALKGENYAIYPARYAKEKWVINTQGVGGFKSRACRLASTITGGNYTNRYKGYVAGKSQVEAFLSLYLDGWDGSIFSDKLYMPSSEDRKRA